MNIEHLSGDGWTRFQTCAQAYGAQRQAWPFMDRGIYDMFAGTVAGQQILVPAADLDKTLNSSEAPLGASADFMQRLQTMALPAQVKVQNYVVVLWKRGAALMLLMAALGFGNGYAEQNDTNQIWQTATMTTEFGLTTPY
jgi:hypothetical protein